MASKITYPLTEILLGLSSTIDLVDPALFMHHQKVASVASDLAQAMGLGEIDRKDLLLASLLHDCGALSLKEKLSVLNFERSFEEGDTADHQERGYLLLRDFKPLTSAAKIIRFHHVWWEGGRGESSAGNPVPMTSHLLHLSDRIAVLLRPEAPVLDQAGEVRDRVVAQSDRMFVPDMVNAFKGLSSREQFWQNAASPQLSTALSKPELGFKVELDVSGMAELTRIFCHMVDYRSHFTATHSTGVAATASALADAMGFSTDDCNKIELAGYLHDLGKLAVPVELIEKPASLTQAEYNLVKGHAFFTDRILQPVSAMDLIREWASSHHERLDGSGYPSHRQADEISQGGRIIAVADVFTALTEDRPYRRGMTLDEALEILTKMAENSVLDLAVVNQLKRRKDEVNTARIEAQNAVLVGYREFKPKRPNPGQDMIS